MLLVGGFFAAVALADFYAGVAVDTQTSVAVVLFTGGAVPYAIGSLASDLQKAFEGLERPPPRWQEPGPAGAMTALSHFASDDLRLEPRGDVMTLRPFHRLTQGNFEHGTNREIATNARREEAPSEATPASDCGAPSPSSPWWKSRAPMSIPNG
jgi:hypothetical protein